MESQVVLSKDGGELGILEMRGDRTRFEGKVNDFGDCR